MWWGRSWFATLNTLKLNEVLMCIFNNNNKIIIIIILLSSDSGYACYCKQSCWSSANHSGSASEWKEFPHQSQSKGSLTHYRFMASSTYKCISTKRLLLLIHVTNFARCCILCLQICPVSGAPLVCVRSTFGPSPELLWQVETLRNLGRRVSVRRRDAGTPGWVWP